jgi:hypothetical protein
MLLELFAVLLPLLVVAMVVRRVTGRTLVDVVSTRRGR